MTEESTARTARKPSVIAGGEIAFVRSRLRHFAASALLAGAALCTACTREESGPDAVRIDGNASRGRMLITELDCGACHAIPGVPGARGSVGPPLAGLAARNFIAGDLPNEPSTLVDFLRDAPSVSPQTAMPALPLSEEDARNVAAYLYAQP